MVNIYTYKDTINELSDMKNGLQMKVLPTKISFCEFDSGCVLGRRVDRFDAMVSFSA